jgi:hypothetical protein
MLKRRVLIRSRFGGVCEHTETLHSANKKIDTYVQMFFMLSISGLPIGPPPPLGGGPPAPSMPGGGPIMPVTGVHTSSCDSASCGQGGWLGDRTVAPEIETKTQYCVPQN